MGMIRAVYENGVFRPTDHVALPEHCLVEFEPRPVDECGQDAARDAVYAVLSRRFASGESDVAARHDEHQP